VHRATGGSPNCGGELERRPLRLAQFFARHPVSTKRVRNLDGCAPVKRRRALALGRGQPARLVAQGGAAATGVERSHSAQLRAAVLPLRATRSVISRRSEFR
jgi:hypothetical protein